MKGYIVSAHHDVKDEKTYVYLYGRLENGQSFVTLNKLEPYFFIEKKEAAKVKSYLSKYTTSETNATTFQNQDVIKISHTDYGMITKLAKVLHDKDINTYEADVKPVQRFLIDNDLKGTIQIEGDSQPLEKIDRYYQDPVIKPVQFHPKLQTVAIDIESDKTTGKLFCIGIYSEEKKTVFMVTKEKVPQVVSCATEEECLEKWKQAIIKLDPDIITGWNVIDFDFLYLKKLFEKHDIPFDIGRDNSQVRLRIESDFFKSSTVAITGRQVLDGLNLMKDPFIQEAPSIKNAKFDSWTLEDVAQSLLGSGKLLKGKDRHSEIEQLYKKDQEKLALYNLQDCKLAYDILEKTQTLELAIERSQLTGLTLDKLTASVAAFDSLYIREARKRKLVSPTTRYTRKEERIKGGYVMESKPGIYHEVIVLDFKSLYPSLIKTFNIDPASFVKKATANTIEAPNGAHFLNTEGILPGIIKTLHEARESAKREKRELASYAIKIIMNSFFGVLANENCRYFSLDIANAITHFGQYLIKLTAEQITERGLNVIYSDTDSIFIETERSNEKANQLGKKLPEEINEFYKEYIQEKYKRTSQLELEFKKHYKAFMMPKVRNLEKGSKKRYAGLIEKNNKEEIEITGLEAIRGDWTEAAQEFQKELLDKVFHRQEVTTFIRSYVQAIKKGKMDSKLIYTKSLRKGLDEYTKTTPPHVKAARLLEKVDSPTISYYITVNGPEPIQKHTHPLDYDHYIKKQIEPIANTILTFFGKTFEELTQESKQTKLFT